MARMKKADNNNRSSNITSSKNKPENPKQQKQLKQQEEEQVEEEEQFSFPMLSGTRQGEEESFRGMYIDMDIALPCAWESMKRQGSSKSSSADSLEFDFGRSLRSLDPASETPADELFHKGLILPLLQKGKLDNEDEEEQDEEKEENAKADSFSFKSEHRLKELDLGCLSPDRFPSAACPDSRSSSFRSSSSYWDSGDKDSGDSSSSCRDSNGSSQDSCFEAPSQLPGAPQPPDMLGVSTKVIKGEDQEKPGRSLNWRKSPFKWKVLLGGSKRASLSASSSCSSTTSSSSAASALKTGDRRRNHSFTYGSSSVSTSSSSGPLLSSLFANGDHKSKYRHSVSSSASSSAKSRAECFSQQSFRDMNSGAPTGSSSSTKVLHKYLKLLKPFVVSGTASGTISSSYACPASSSAKRAESAGFYGPSPRPAARSVDDWRAAMAYYDQQREQHDKELITCPSFLPGSLRVSSFSTSRRSSTHASCVTSSRSSPNHSGVLRQSSDPSGSGMADLQSAVQGAIAHCKKSQTSTSAVRLSGSGSLVSVPTSTAVSVIDLGLSTAAAGSSLSSS